MKKTTKLFCTFSILLSFGLFSSSYCQSDGYSQFSGKSKRADYEIYMQNHEGQLSGNLYFKLLPNDSAGISRRIEFIGKLTADSTFTLHKFTEETDFATGNFANDILSLYIQITDSLIDTINLPLSYLPTEFRYQLINTNKTVSLLNNADSPEASFEMSILIPDTESKLEIRKTVLKFLNILPDSIENTAINPLQLIETKRDTFLNDYLKLKTMYDLNGASFNWFYISSTQILYNSPNLFCLENTIYAFTGGAHGMENNAYGIFNCLTNKQLQKSDVFKSETDSILTNLITNSIKTSLKISQDSSLPFDLFFVKQAEPNENIYLTPAGIGFYYNSYEIAPYAFGQTNVFFPFEELEVLLNDDFKRLMNWQN